MTGGDRLNLDDCRLPDEAVRERTVVPQRIKKRGRQFVKVPLALVDLLARQSRDKTFAVLCHLLHLDWKRGGGPIKLPSGFLEMTGVGRSAKSRALDKLESLGIVTVERRDRKSPIVKINEIAEREGHGPIRTK